MLIPVGAQGSLAIIRRRRIMEHLARPPFHGTELALEALQKGAALSAWPEGALRTAGWPGMGERAKPAEAAEGYNF